jgi:predicted NAD-dependent protein-ADP-ribosyltransferase YbiA (DUF1768 family)
LSENFPCSIFFEGLEWPTVQHLFQASKIDKSAENSDKLREAIRNEPDLKRVKALGHKVPLDKNFEDFGHKLNVMFRITYQKFRQNPHLAARILHETADKPIWHFCEDVFWGTSKSEIGASSQEPKSARSLSGRTAGATKPWWSGDNWNGKILAVVRILLRQRISLRPQDLKSMVEEDFRKHCPCPEEFFQQSTAALRHPHTEQLKPGTLIAGMYTVSSVKVCKDMGACIGCFCYICEDESPCDPAEEDMIRESIAGRSLSELRDLISAALRSLCSATDPDWPTLHDRCAALRRERFFDGPVRRWWTGLEARLRDAEALATACRPLSAAHALRQLMPSPPLLGAPMRPRVFVKTFNQYSRKIVAEIRRCSAKAPDFGRGLHHEAPGWPVREIGIGGLGIGRGRGPRVSGLRAVRRKRATVLVGETGVSACGYTCVRG